MSRQLATRRTTAKKMGLGGGKKKGFGAPYEQGGVGSRKGLKTPFPTIISKISKEG